MEIARPGKSDELAHAERNEDRGEELKHTVGREPDHADGDRDQHGAAQDTRH